jgi:hypothetical protein
MAVVARKKPEADIALVFGGAPKKKPGMMDGGDLEGARDLLKQASGWDDDVLDALHEYVMACSSMKPSEPDADDSMDMEGE